MTDALAVVVLRRNSFIEARPRSKLRRTDNLSANGACVISSLSISRSGHPLPVSPNSRIHCSCPPPASCDHLTVGTYATSCSPRIPLSCCTCAQLMVAGSRNILACCPALGIGPSRARQRQGPVTAVLSIPNARYHRAPARVAPRSDMILIATMLFDRHAACHPLEDCLPAQSTA